jgi:hypothetical protein
MTQDPPRQDDETTPERRIAVVGPRRRSVLTTMLLATAALGVMPDLGLGGRPRPERAEDADAMTKAEAKRARKAAKRLAERDRR